MRELFCAVLLAASLGAATPDPVAWTIAAAPAKPVKPGAKFSLKLVARIREGWHLYGMRPVAEGPIPTRIRLIDGQPFQLAGSIQATEPETVQDPSFGMEVELYEGEAVFTLPVRAAASAPPGARNIVVYASYQSCNNKICLPPKTVKVEAAVTISK